MRIWAEIFTAAGVRQGIVDLVSLHTSQKLDSVGSFNFLVAPNNPNNESLLVIGRRAHFYAHDGVRRFFVGQGILQQRQFTDAAQQRMIRWSGADAMEELRQIFTGAGRVFRDVTIDAAAFELLGLMPQRWWASIDSGLGNTSIRFDSVSVYRALFSITGKKGVHMRLGNTPNRVDIGAMGVDSGIRLVNTMMLPWEIFKNPFAGLVEQLELVSDAFEVVNWIVPLAGAGAEAALSLEDCTLSTPYAVESETGPDGKTIYFIQDSTSVAAYGKIQRAMMLQDLVPVRAEFEAWRNGANVLYEWAAAQLTRMKDPHVTYKATVRGLRKIILPGDKVRLSYVGTVWQFGQSVQWANINDLFWVVGAEYTLDDNGLQAVLELSDVDIEAASPEVMLADGMTALRDGQIAVQLQVERLDDTQSTQVIETLQAQVTEVNLQFRPSTLTLSQALMKITRNEFQGPDTLIIDVDNQKYAENVLGGASTNEVTLDIRRMLIDRTLSGIDIQDQHKILIEPTYSRGPLTVDFDIVEVSASVATEALSGKEIALFDSVDQNDVGLGDATYDSLAQTFTVDAATESYYGALFRLKKSGTPYFDYIRAKLFEDEFGDGALHQAVAGGASELVKVADLSSYYKDRFFHTPDMPSLAAGLYSVRLTPEIIDGLVLACDMHEASGEREDWSGNGNHLQDNNGVGQAEGPDGETPYADLVKAGSEFLSIGDANQVGLNSFTEMSIETTIYPNSLPSSNVANAGLVSKRGGAGNRAYLLYISAATDRISFEVSNDGSTLYAITSTSAISISTWYRVITRWDGSYLYLNINGTDITPVAFGGPMFVSSASFNVGSYADSTGLTFDGRQGRVRVWNRCLTDDEVAARQAGNSTHHVEVAADDDITEDLLSLWQLDENTSGESRRDVWNHEDLTPRNSAGAAQGLIRSAGHFARTSSQYLDRAYADLTDLIITGYMSIGAYVYLDSLPSTAGAQFTIVSRWVTTGDQRSYMLYLDTSNQLVFSISSDGTLAGVKSATNTSAPLSVNTWYSVLGIYDGANVISIVNDTTQVGTAHTGAIHAGTSDFNVAAYENGASGYFDGRIDHLAIWERALASAERTRWYGSGAGLDILALNYYRYGRLVAESSGAWASKIMDADFKALRSA